MILVDDEEFIVQGIASVIDWQSHHAELAATALDGESGLKEILRHQPDIVITDIRMPGIDGMELIKRTKELLPNVRFIVLSGYGDFQYAQQAMNYGVKHYLLKPCNEMEIIHALEQLMKEIEETQQKELSIRAMKQNLEKVMPQIKEQFLKEYLLNKRYSHKDWDYYARLFQLEPIVAPVCVLTFQLEHEMVDYEYYFALQNIAVEILQENGSVFMSTTIGQNIVILMESAALPALQKDIFRIQEIYQSYYKMSFSVAISEADEIRQARSLYKETLECLKHKFYLGESAIIAKSDLVGQRQEDMLPFDFDSLCLCLRSGLADEAAREIDDFFEELIHSQMNMNKARSHCLTLFSVILKESDSAATEHLLKRAVQIVDMPTLAEMKRLIVGTMEEIAEAHYREQRNSYHSIVRKALEFTDGHLEDPNLSLNYLAQQILYLNAHYLGKLFKSETGMKYTDYLMNARMEKAKELIEKNRKLKIYQIADATGLSENSQYFSQVFKKHTGYTPSEYKAIIHDGQEDED
ncbi:response regulator transcription factor [Cohnella thailandensis]|uniref:response regulator transcription factor n=1 Tax=Cohnella thailandensis TaxID=557557 RepID=UPI00315A4097